MIKTVQMIEVDDWDALVVKTYGRPYSFQQQDGCKPRGTFNLCVPEEAAEEYDYENDIIPEEVNGNEMGVSFKAWLARDPNQKLATEDEWERNHGLDFFWTRNFYPAIEMVANDLHSKGLLPAGEYIINIDW
jgi:hypothetical protein